MREGIVVVGSYNASLFFKGSRIPAVSETLMGESFYDGPGGKGSNQAIAASVFGCRTVFCGKFGSDSYAGDAFAMYRRQGITTDYLFTDESAHTGMAVILVDDQGNNSIMVVPGANYCLSPGDIDRCEPAFRAAKLVGFQLENKVETVLYGIRKAREAGAQVLLDPAPACPLPEDIYPSITYIKPNEIEAATLSGIPVTDYASAERAAEWFLSRGVSHAIITIGALGAVVADAEGVRIYKVPPLPAPPIDTTGAGDTFSGAFMAKLAQSETIDRAVRFAICASSLSVTKAGVVEAIPTLEEARAFFDEMGER